ncbi:MAG: hypothetical protein EZS28_010044 [Streblomastix strix]|uniref:Dynein heavy chain AAA 5 extension domain-containing protein n=1 Tax=Streblomastix strix TaxID=222440 RepID=A0A5J4WIT1_9EUKA|nr:MAG: hypothetical protein EZS28_010044 [Streblomastix strix]
MEYPIYAAMEIIERQTWEMLRRPALIAQTSPASVLCRSCRPITPLDMCVNISKQLYLYIRDNKHQKNAGGSKGSGNNKDLFTEFISNTTTGIVASLLELFTLLADSYASMHTSKIADAQFQLRMDAVTEAGGRRGKRRKKGNQKKAEREKEANAQSILNSQRTIPSTHTVYPPPPGNMLNNKKYYEDQYPASIAAKHFVFALIWTFGAALDDHSKPKFSEFFMELIAVEIKTEIVNQKKQMQLQINFVTVQKKNNNTPNQSLGTTPQIQITISSIR